MKDLARMSIKKQASTSALSQPIAESDVVFQTAAELFGLLSTPVRLKILSALCDSEKNVSQMLLEIPVSQPNLSQHLAALYKAKVLGKRREGAQIFYYVVNSNAVAICRSVCSQVAFDLDDESLN
jgi:DNA-binding transcriptional ArsR family regulator